MSHSVHSSRILGKLSLTLLLLMAVLVAASILCLAKVEDAPYLLPVVLVLVSVFLVCLVAWAFIIYKRVEINAMLILKTTSAYSVAADDHANKR